MNILDLFSGIGGFSLGLERAGMKTIAFCEKDKYCQKVLEKHWPEIPIFEDITKLKGEMINETINLICGGPPCQPASVAGKRKGTKDDRWLWGETYRIIRETKPEWVLLENVKGIFTLEQGMVFENLLLELESYGYETEAFIIPACAVNAPHRRERVWIVANSEGIRRKWGGGVSRKASGKDKEGIATASERSNKTCNILSSATSERCDNWTDNRQERHILRNKNRNAQESESAREGWECGTGEINTNASNTEITTRGLSIGEETEYPRHRSNDWDENWIEVATRLCGVDARIPARMDRLKCLGNSVVPQIVEIIGNYIMEVERTSKIQKEMFV